MNRKRRSAPRRWNPGIARFSGFDSAAGCRSSCRSTRAGRAPAGFTLFEVLLVLVLLLMVIAVSWPAISRLFTEDHLRESLSTLQLKFGSARIQALERQIPYQFCYEPGGRRFIFIPALFAESAERNSTQSTATIPWVAAEELPEGFRLEGRTLTSVIRAPANDTAQNQAESKSFDIPEAWLVDLPNSDRFRGVVWSAPILIRPDGSATAAEFALVDDRNQEYRMLVRSITGTLRSLSTPRGAPAP